MSTSDGLFPSLRTSLALDAGGCVPHQQGEEYNSGFASNPSSAPLSPMAVHDKYMPGRHFDQQLTHALHGLVDQTVPGNQDAMQAYKRKSSYLDSASSGSESGKRNRNGRTDDVSIEELREKNEARLLRNRLSAKQSRERKKQFIGTLEQQVDQLKRTKTELEAIIARLLWENDQLRSGAAPAAALPAVSLPPDVQSAVRQQAEIMGQVMSDSALAQMGGQQYHSATKPTGALQQAGTPNSVIAGSAVFQDMPASLHTPRNSLPHHGMPDVHLGANEHMYGAQESMNHTEMSVSAASEVNHALEHSLGEEHGDLSQFGLGLSAFASNLPHEFTTE